MSVKKNTIGAIIKENRIKLGMTQEELGYECYVEKQAVSAWENGKTFPNNESKTMLEELFGIKLDYVNVDIPELNKINSIEYLQDTIEAIVNNIEVEKTYLLSIREMLKLFLIEVVAYVIYYEKYCQKGDDDIVAWDYISDLVSDFIGGNPYVLKISNDYIDDLNRFKAVVHALIHRIGGELFEDFDDEGYIDLFPQQIGRLGEEAGYELLNILPSIDCSIMVCFRIALHRLSDFLWTIK